VDSDTSLKVLLGRERDFAPLLVEANNGLGKTPLLADIAAICVGVEGL
jgi:hypothetical protein